MIIGMDMEEIEAAARARIEELKPAYEEYLALQKLFRTSNTSYSDAPSGPRRSSYRGRPALPAFLVDLMSDGERRTLDQLEEIVKLSPEFADRAPTRNTIATRLNEIANKPDTFAKLPDGSYQRKS